MKPAVGCMCKKDARGDKDTRTALSSVLETRMPHGELLSQ